MHFPFTIHSLSIKLCRILTWMDFISTFHLPKVSLNLSPSLFWDWGGEASCTFVICCVSRTKAKPCFSLLSLFKKRTIEMDVGVSSEWTWIFDHFRPWRNESFISSGTFTNNQVVASQGQALINLFRPSLMDWGPGPRIGNGKILIYLHSTFWQHLWRTVAFVWDPRELRSILPILGQKSQDEWEQCYRFSFLRVPLQNLKYYEIQ